MVSYVRRADKEVNTSSRAAVPARILCARLDIVHAPPPSLAAAQTATTKPHARCCRTGGARAWRQAAGAWGRVKAGEELRLLGHTGPVCHPSGIVVPFS